MQPGAIKQKIHDLSTEEVVALAISMERSNCLALRGFSQYFEGADEWETALRFTELAQEEARHEVVLSGRYAAMFKGSIPEAENPSPIGAVEELDFWALEQKISGARNTAREIFVFALAAENRARDFYLEAAEKVDNKELALLFKELATLEVDHACWLENKIDRA